MEMQKLEIMVHGMLEVHDEDFEPSEWRPLPKSPLAQRQSPGKQAGSSSETKSKTQTPNDLAYGDIATQVWPAFFANVEDGAYLPVSRGYVLTKAAVVAAQEANAASAPERSRRGERDKQRMGKRLMMNGNDSLENFLSKSPSGQKHAG